MEKTNKKNAVISTFTLTLILETAGNSYITWLVNLISLNVAFWIEFLRSAFCCRLHFIQHLHLFLPPQGKNVFKQTEKCWALILASLREPPFINSWYNHEDRRLLCPVLRQSNSHKCEWKSTSAANFEMRLKKNGTKDWLTTCTALKFGYKFE